MVTFDDERHVIPEDEETLNASVEVMHSHLSHKPIVLPPTRSESSRSKARRRWKMLKNVARFTSKRSSLTSHEVNLLNVIEKNSTTKKEQAEEREEKEQQKKLETCSSERRKLRQSIHVAKLGLTDAEKSFLEDLADNDEIDAEYLENAHKVLTTDPLYDDKLSEDFKKEELDAEKRKPAPPIPEDSAFRRETWEYYLGSSASFRAALSPDKPKQRKNLLPEESFVAQPPKKKELSLLDRILGRTEEDEKKMPEEPEVEEDLVPPPPVILATSATDDDCTPHVMSPPIMDALRPYMPFAVQEDNFWLKYSMVRDGASMRSLVYHVRSSARTIIAIETMKGDVFGAFTSSPWRPQGHEYYGSGEAFVWKLIRSRNDPTSNVEEQIQLESQVQVFPWSGQNRNVQSLVNLESPLVIGGGGPDDDPFAEEKTKGVALLLEPTLFRGSSNSSVTFDSKALTVNEEEFFDIANIEVWTMTPVENLTQAEKLELGRQFVFDHGHFVES